MSAHWPVNSWKDFGYNYGIADHPATERDLGMELRGYNYAAPRLVQLPCVFNIS